MGLAVGVAGQGGGFQIGFALGPPGGRGPVVSMPNKEQLPPKALPLLPSAQVLDDGQEGVDPQAQGYGISGEVGREADGLSVALLPV